MSGLAFPSHWPHTEPTRPKGTSCSWPQLEPLSAKREGQKQTASEAGYHPSAQPFPPPQLTWSSCISNWTTPSPYYKDLLELSQIWRFLWRHKWLRTNSLLVKQTCEPTWGQRADIPRAHILLKEGLWGVQEIKITPYALENRRKFWITSGSNNVGEICLQQTDFNYGPDSLKNLFTSLSH